MRNRKKGSQSKIDQRQLRESFEVTAERSMECHGGQIRGTYSATSPPTWKRIEKLEEAMVVRGLAHSRTQQSD